MKRFLGETSALWAAEPAISAVVLSYNARPRIDIPLRSLMCQDLDESHEVIVVDSGSDGCAEYVRRRYPGVRLVRSEPRLLPGEARNAGVRAARGRYIAFLADDCSARPDWLRRRLSGHREGFDLVGGAVTNGTPWHPVGAAGYYLEYTAVMPSKRILGEQVVPHSLSYDGRLFERHGLFPTGLRAGEDTVFNERCVAGGASVKLDPDVAFSHRNITELRRFVRHQHEHGRALIRCVEEHGLGGGRRSSAGQGGTAARRLLLRYPARRWWSGLLRVTRGRPRGLPAYIVLTPLIWMGAGAAAVGAWCEQRAAQARAPSLRTSAQLLLARTGSGRLRPAWSAVYRGAARALAGYLRHAQAGSAAYVGGSAGFGRVTPALSDIDLVIVTPDDAGAQRVRRRWRRLTARLPLLARLADVDVYDERELREALRRPYATYGLEDRAREASIYAAGASGSRVSLHERPRLYQPAASWRLVAGPDRRPPRPMHDVDARRIAAWAELQEWWSQMFRLCAQPGRPDAALLSAKAQAEAARAWLWLAEDRVFASRREALERALEAFPGEEEGLREALRALERPASASPALHSTVSTLLALSARVATALAADASAAGGTPVRLVAGDGRGPLLPPAAHKSLRRLSDGFPESRVLPLADWRARALASFDEAFVALGPEGVSAERLRGAALAQRGGAYAGLRHGDLLVLPTADLARGAARLRAIQCAVSDPVSAALADGAPVALFPDLPGWSAHDTARRALAERRALLQAARRSGRRLDPGGLLAAARASLFAESIEAGDPQLAVTLEATARLLAERHPEKAELLAETYEEHRAERLAESVSPGVGVAELALFVESLGGLEAHGNGRAPAARRPGSRQPAVGVSVVVAAYDEEQHIARLLSSLRRQTLPPLEVIVADDGSRDRTADIAERAGARVLRLPHRGPARARNAGAAVARGELLVFLDGDMAVDEAFIERLVAPILLGDACGSFSSEIYLGNPENRWARAYAALRGSPPDRLLPPDFPRRWENFRAVRRDRFLAAGGYDDVGYGEDMTLAPKLGELAAVAPGAICLHHHPSSFREVFANARWIGRGAAIRTLRRPWRAHSPYRMVQSALQLVRQGRTPWVLPARVVYHVGIWLGLAESSLAPRRHWK